MKTIILRNNSIHAGNLILVNAQYPYQEQAGTDQQPIDTDQQPIVKKQMIIDTDQQLIVKDQKQTDADQLAPVHNREKSVLLKKQVVNALSRLMDKLDGWQQICAVSGWRSQKEQEEIFNESLRKNGRLFTNQYVALPGSSEHQTGLAIDLALKKEPIDFICPDFPYTGICQTFRVNAAAFGFIERYAKNKESITGIAHEPWHFRYVGTPHAEIMTSHGLALEEYIEFLKNYRYGKARYLYSLKHLRIFVSYLKAEETTYTPLQMEEHHSYTISGNNVDGFIITEWRQAHGRS